MKIGLKLTVSSWVLLTLACGQPDRRVRVIYPDEATGKSSLQDIRSTTLESVHRVRGSVARFRSGAAIQVDTWLSYDEKDSDSVQRPHAVRARFVLDRGVAVPTDYDSLVMLSAYVHVERAALFFYEIGVEPAGQRVNVYYEPTLHSDDDPDLPNRDNAAFLPQLDGFVLLPMNALDHLPLAANQGVIGHEYAHRVFFHQVWHASLFDTLASHADQAGAAATWNRLRATDEGVADFFGALISNEVDFLAESIPSEIADARRVTETKLMPARWVTGLEPVTETTGEYDPYAVGAIIAAALWSLGEHFGRDRVAHAVVEAEELLSTQVTEAFQYYLGDLEALVIGQLPTEDQAAACDLLRDPYEPAWPQLTARCD